MGFVSLMNDVVDYARRDFGVSDGIRFELLDLEDMEEKDLLKQSWMAEKVYPRVT